MPKTKKDGEAGLGDWSSTGTFLRKPQSGWLHEERELKDGSSINYQIKYLGCMEVKQSMRTLQYTVRTQVTKEAIVRMAEWSNSLLQHKKRKVPKQVNKLLGSMDNRWAGDVNLSVSVDHLKISNPAGREIMNHSLPSISFASGGEGATVDFIGYVAKDPVHERACHVFECPSTSQYVLTTIGQAFELRYKIYLTGPRGSPVQVQDCLDGDAWGPTHMYEDGGTSWGDTPLPQVPSEPPPGGAGIYSDLPEFPNPESPLFSPPPPLPESRSRVYSKLPGFPTGETTYDNGPGLSRRENPYDVTGGAQPQMRYSESGVYSNPGEVTTSGEDVYDNRLMTIRQQSVGAGSDLIDLTPPQSRKPPTHAYSNVGDVPSPHVYGNVGPGEQPEEDSMYDNQAVEEVRSRTNTYDDPHYLANITHLQRTSTGVYDNPGEIFAELDDRRGVYDNREGVVGKSEDGHLYDKVAEDEPGDMPPTGVRRPPQGSQRSNTPKFDDTIYAVRRANENGSAVPGGKGLQDLAPLQEALVHPLGPLPQQQYYHGAISRVEAEALLVSDGEFLVRESKKNPGQFVLTGMAKGLPQHLLLMDKHGKVKSRDHEFDSVAHLVHYFTGRKLPLVIGKSQVFLHQPIVNAFPVTGFR